MIDSEATYLDDYRAYVMTETDARPNHMNYGIEHARARELRLESVGFPNGRYGVILADPPWKYETYSDKGQERSPKYDKMTVDQICRLPIHDITATDCVLFLWCIDTHIPHMLDVMYEWGFEFKTKGFCWVKANKVSDGFHMGMGHWTRGNPEDCWLGSYGSPHRVDKGVRRLLFTEDEELDIMTPHISRLMENSRKPDELYERIERLVGGPYIELFARRRREGWDSWGNQLPTY